jgi:hypothetical protein
MSDPKYPSNAFIPHGTWVGLQMGANAEVDAKTPGYLSDKTRAPCPPIECPIMDTCSIFFMYNLLFMN